MKFILASVKMVAMNHTVPGCDRHGKWHPDMVTDKDKILIMDVTVPSESQWQAFAKTQE